MGNFATSHITKVLTPAMVSTTASRIRLVRTTWGNGQVQPVARVLRSTLFSRNGERESGKEKKKDKADLGPGYSMHPTQLWSLIDLCDI